MAYKQSSSTVTNDKNLKAAEIRLQPVSVTRKMAASLPGLRAQAEEQGLRIHHLGAGYPHPEVTDPTSFLEATNRWFAHLRDVDGVNDRDLIPEYLREMYAYTDTLGPLSPRNSFATVYGADWGLAMDPARLIPTVGATGGIALLCSTFERPGQALAYITDAPTYAGFLARSTLNQNAAIYSVDMDAEGPDPAQFRAQINQAREDGYFVPFYYTVPDGHNPAGFSFGAERRRALLKIAQDERVLVVEDAPYLYISYADPSERPMPFMTLDPTQTVHLFTGSKIGLPGPRVGFAYTEAVVEIADGEMVDLTDLLLTEASADVLFQNPHALRSFEALLRQDDGSIRPSLWPVAEEKLAIYRENRRILLDGLEDELGQFRDRFHWTEPEAGFFSVFTFKQAGVVTDDAFIQKFVERYGVVVVPMYDFYPDDARERNGRAGLNQLRLSFCFSESTGPSRRLELTEAVRAFGQAVKAESGIS